MASHSPLGVHPDRLLPSDPGVRAVARHLHLRGLGAPVRDTAVAPFLEAAAGGDLTGAAPAVLELLEPGLADDSDFVTAVLAQAQQVQQP